MIKYADKLLLLCKLEAIEKKTEHQDIALCAIRLVLSDEPEDSKPVVLSITNDTFVYTNPDGSKTITLNI